MTNNKNTIVMKTNYYNSRKLSIYSIIGLLALMATSCGSYQNKSYYDRDGIYGGESEKVAQTATNDGQAKTTESNKYTDYFNSLRDGQTDEVFTDVEGYSSYKDTVATQDRIQSAAWGSNPSNVTVNVYDNNWGYNGWNNYWYGNYWGYNNLAWNSWYGPNWGWGWNSWYGPSWGYNNYWYGNYWGYNNWYGNGYYNGYYGNGYYQNYAHGNGRRGSTYGRPEGNSSRDYRRSSNTITRSTTVTGTRRADYTPTRTTPTRNNTIRNNSTTPVRDYNNSNTTRDNSNTTRSNSSSPTRTTTSPTRNNTYTPSNNSSNTTRSNTYTPSSNSNSSPTRSNSGGGGNSGGGTRSSGGGRR